MPQNRDQRSESEIELEEAATLERAAVYVRVSSVGQLGRDGDEDGYSIPAQVAGTKRKASELGALVAKIYAERAESARSDDRPVLQQMLAELPTLGVRYLIVHKVDRLARNRLDDALLYERLIGMGITLVSASENIDATPAGRLMHGMLATFAEYYSNNLATEIKKGLTQKHLSGGTPFKAPIGYLSTRELIGAQDIRGVAVDSERAPLVKAAFALSASGDWTLRQITEYLDAQGLRSRPTPKRGPMPLRLTSVHKMLKNIYYTGIVEYAGRRVPGRHEPLIDRATFDQVQAHLAARAVAGDRPSKHEHYLRGTLACADCGGRLLYGLHTGRGGTYAYYSCVNRRTRRHGGSCDTGFFRAELIESAIIEHYRTVKLTESKQAEIWADVRRDGEERAGVARNEIARHERTISTLEANQARLVQLSYKELVSETVLAREQHRLDDERQQAQTMLSRAKRRVVDVEAELEEALNRTKTPYATYQAGSPLVRRILNQAFFKRILIGEDNQVVGVTLTPAYAAVAAWHEPFGQPVARSRRTGDGGREDAQAAREDEKANPEPFSRDRGLPFVQMVETAGIEPASAIA
jgi:site-specific DNA recombinase